MPLKRVANRFGRAAGAILIVILMPIPGFFPGGVFGAESRNPASQAVGSPSNKSDRGAPEPSAERRADGSIKTSFPAGAWSLYGYGAAAVGKTSHRVYAGKFGLGYHVVDDFSLNLEAAGYFVDHARDTGGGGVDMLFRWHPVQGQDSSLYLDGGPGFVYTRKTLRDPGTHFNFTVQGGAGFTYRITDRFHSMAGLRWFHISNARIRGKNRNVGFDSPMFYLGLMLPYQ